MSGNTPDLRILRPHVGPQEQFFSSGADVVIYGGGAGGGKTWSLLVEALRWVTTIPGYNAVIFRRTTPEIRAPGGMWDESLQIYPDFGGVERHQYLDWTFSPYGNRVKFSHLQREESVLDWKGAAICFLGFDELTSFSEAQFTYMLSRNRSTSGVRPYVRATTNPDADSWVRRWVAPWVDPEHPLYPVPPGELLWFRRGEDVPDEARPYAIHQDGEMVWVVEGCPHAKSLTYIPALAADNPTLLAADPGYLANLHSLSRVERERLLKGSWLARERAGEMFPPDLARLLYREPQITRRVRAWDLASTAEQRSGGKAPDRTAGALLGATAEGRVVVLDYRCWRGTPGETEARIREAAEEDGKGVPVYLEEVRGGAGKLVVEHYSRSVLPGWRVEGVWPVSDKVARARPLAAAWEHGEVDLLAAPWNDALIRELGGFPGAMYDDGVDAVAMAFNALKPKASQGGGASFGKPRPQQHPTRRRFR